MANGTGSLSTTCCCYYKKRPRECGDEETGRHRFLGGDHQHSERTQPRSSQQQQQQLVSSIPGPFFRGSFMELCELQLYPEDDTWPSDIDTRIAQLDFGGDSALFASSSVSTDSLDSEQLRERCRHRTEDFQLTFADSGHWQSGQLTTWGRIRSTEPLDETTASAPTVVTRPLRTPSTATGNQRPTSLLANFVGREQENGRYVDVNDNEIQIEAASASTSQDRWRVARPAASSAPANAGAGGSFVRVSAPSKPRRTFADLHKSIAPELRFLALPHQAYGHLKTLYTFRIHPPNWAHSTASRHVLCDCSPDRPETSHELMPRSRSYRSSGSQQIRARELSVVGLPIYATKRSMVEAVVDAVAAIARGDEPNLLFTALAALVSDGLKDEVSPWSMIRTVTAPGPATKDVYSIVNKLDSSEKSENSRVEQFFEELFRENSLDCWLCYVVLKENVLRRLYSPGSFLLDAPTAYRTLLWLLEVRECSQPHYTQSMLWSGPCRLPADSRVPKSSSVPARLSNSHVRNHRRSRIPLPKSRVSMHRTLSPMVAAAITASPLASVIADVCEPGLLVVSRGERVRVLSRRGDIARCCRVHRRPDVVSTGIVPLGNLLIPS
ncbi:hypothetical protein GCK32_011072 [Trichostrongylus colubriformis]|uniref:RUN domain-containing protein n=1 Tax=Trichostrongylus colubriformis TaxID=6319 RepID=A0AAN8F0A0_TRICO